MPFTAVCPHCRNCRLRAPWRKRGLTMLCPKCQRDFALVPHDEVIPPDRPPPTAVAPDDSRLALVPIGAVFVALLLCYLPFGRAAAVGLVLAGGAMAWLSLLDGRWVWLGRIGVALNGLLLLTLLAFPARLGLAGWGSKPRVEEVDRGVSWIDAAEAGWEEDGVQVALTFATVGPDVSGGGRSLRIGVSVTNAGPRTVEFAGWNAQAAGGPVLTTVDGSPVAGGRAGGVPAKTLLAPGQSAECVLAFGAPAAEGDLLLDLPAGAYGGTTPARFWIPQTVVEWQ